MFSSAAGTEPLRQAEAAVAPQHAPRQPPRRQGSGSLPCCQVRTRGPANTGCKRGASRVAYCRRGAAGQGNPYGSPASSFSPGATPGRTPLALGEEEFGSTPWHEPAAPSSSTSSPQIYYYYYYF